VEEIMAGQFVLTPESDGSLSLESAVFQALGFASMCWSGSPRGVFQSDQAKAAGDVLVEFIRAGRYVTKDGA
jgi:hypothetical protein